MSFDSLGLNPEILRAIAEQGYVEPTPIQQQAIPAVLQGRDLMARPALRPVPAKRRDLRCRCFSI